MLHNLYKIAIVIPCYNEEKRLPVSEFLSYFEKNKNINFFFVNDGSKDNTLEVLNSLSEGRSDKISIINLEKNSGKAEAVRCGVRQAIKSGQFDYIGYFDADLSTPLDEISNFIKEITEAQNPDFIIGSRVKLLGRKIERKWYRHYLGRLFSTVVNLILNISIYDSQCGAKLIKTNLAENIFEQPLISAWLFDVELLMRTIVFYGQGGTNDHIIEVPLKQWLEKGDSRLRFSDFLKLPFELLKIYFKYKY